jgi:RNase adaptor protein for sRNA GlmZ degradation
MLKIRLYSFSFPGTGIPVDTSGNYGGFVFDCRFINNPGKYQEFMTLTGKDPEIISFLDADNIMQQFLKDAYKIIDACVESYLSKNFTDLMISFGCTGGRHRSVYSVEKTNKHLIDKFGSRIHIELNHIGLNIQG